MKIGFILFGLIIIIACNNSEKEYSFNRNYIKSARILDDSCRDKIRNYLIPLGLEDDSTSITQVYQLNVAFDTNFVDNVELKGKFYIGLIYNNDTAKKDILEFDSDFNFIHFCYTIDNHNNLFVFNGHGFLHNFKLIENFQCLRLDTNILLRNSKIDGYQVEIDRNSWRGKWLPDTINFSKFKEKNLNRYWIFSESLSDKMVQFINDRDTIISNYIFESDTLSLTGFDTKFFIFTETRKCLIVYDFINETHHCLNKK